MTINLHFVKWNQISTYGKLNLPLASSIYFVFLSVKMTGANQSIPLIFLLCLKRNNTRTFKSGTCKNIFLRCVRYWYNLLRWILFILCVNWKGLFFVKVYRFLWRHWFERSPYFMCYLHNNNMMLIPEFQRNSN